jgi:hypothetical protein
MTMMSITITRTVLTGNMGDGWRDEAEAAHAYGAYLEAALTAYARGSYPEAQVVTRVMVQEGSGDSGTVGLVSDLPAWRHGRLLEALCDTAKHAWETFCDNEIADILCNE